MSFPRPDERVLRRHCDKILKGRSIYSFSNSGDHDRLSNAYNQKLICHSDVWPLVFEMTEDQKMHYLNFANAEIFYQAVRSAIFRIFPVQDFLNAKTDWAIKMGQKVDNTMRTQKDVTDFSELPMNSWRLMWGVLTQKFENPEMINALMSTSNRYIVAKGTDPFWAVGSELAHNNYDGQNMLGLMLMLIRDAIYFKDQQHFPENTWTHTLLGERGVITRWDYDTDADGQWLENVPVLADDTPTAFWTILTQKAYKIVEAQTFREFEARYNKKYPVLFGVLRDEECTIFKGENKPLHYEIKMKCDRIKKMSPKKRKSLLMEFDLLMASKYILDPSIHDGTNVRPFYMHTKLSGNENDDLTVQRDVADALAFYYYYVLRPRDGKHAWHPHLGSIDESINPDFHNHYVESIEAYHSLIVPTTFEFKDEVVYIDINMVEKLLL